METYGPFRIEQAAEASGSLRAHACVLSAMEGDGDQAREVFRVIAWVTDRLADLHRRAPDELAVEHAFAYLRELVDKQTFERDRCYRFVEGFDALHNREVSSRDKIALDAFPHPPLPSLR